MRHEGGERRKTTTGNRGLARGLLLRIGLIIGPGGTKLSLFMDMHTLAGVSASDAAAAHQKDLETQGKYGVKYLRYWVDEAEGKVFCLVEADSAADAVAVHRDGHGLVADEIYAVTEHT